MTESHRERGSAASWAAFAGCSAIWGSTFLVISIGNDALPPLWAATVRLGLAAVLLTALTRLRGQRLPRGAALRAAAGFGFLNFGLSFCLLYWGEKTVPSGLTAVIYATVPLSTALFAGVFGLERFSAFKLVGAVVALAGVAVIFGGSPGTRLTLVPLAAVLSAATCASLSGVVLKLGPRQPPLGANAVGAIVGLAVCLAASLIAREDHRLPLEARALVPVLYLTIAGSVGAFVLYAWLVNRWPVTRISFIAVIVPVVALMLGVLVRHERPEAGALLGSTLVLAGVVLGTRSPRAEPAR